MDETETEADGLDAKNDFRIVSTGHFAMQVEPKRADGSLIARVACTGDINTRRITSVEYNGTIKRPPVGASWSF